MRDRSKRGIRHRRLEIHPHGRRRAVLIVAHVVLVMTNVGHAWMTKVLLLLLVVDEGILEVVLRRNSTGGGVCKGRLAVDTASWVGSCIPLARRGTVQVGQTTADLRVRIRLRVLVDVLGRWWCGRRRRRGRALSRLVVKVDLTGRNRVRRLRPWRSEAGRFEIRTCLGHG